MKRIWLFLSLFAATVFQSNAQTTIPFYGFELSNYEVGDTLLYIRDHNDYAWESNWKTLLVVTDKENLGTEISYTFQKTERYWHWSVANEIDTLTQTSFSISITNDPVVGNSNNILGMNLYSFDSALVEPGGYITYGVAGGLKEVEYNAIFLGGYSVEYLLFQNLGIVKYDTWQFNGSDLTTDDLSLLYARLQYYGVYGEYDPIALSVAATKNKSPVLNYNALDKTLRLKAAAGAVDKVELFDVLGHRVLTSEFKSKSIPLNHLPTGVYFFQLIGEQTSTGKILVH